MTKWEYAVSDMDPTDEPLAPRLDLFGGAGWELVAVVPPPGRRNFIRYVFKRPVQ